MKAVDTNVVLRYLRRDDERQSRIADDLLATPCFVPLTVLLETGWVLGSHYDVPRGMVAEVLQDFVDLDTVHTEDLALTRWALSQYREGADLADMFHVVAARGATHFSTFDREVEKRAGGDPPVPIETLR